MYTSLLAKQQIKIAVGLWQKQHLQLLTVKLITSANLINTGHRNYNAISSNQSRQGPSHIRKWLHQRQYSHNTEQEENHGKQLQLSPTEAEKASISIAEEENSQNLKLKQLLYNGEDDIIKKLNATQCIEEVSNVYAGYLIYFD